MIHFIISLLINALVLFIIAYLTPQVHIKNYGTAVLVALFIGILNATVGFLIRLPLNIMTFGLLSFIIRLLVTALIIKIVDKLMDDFEVKGFLVALLLAVVMALTGTFLDRLAY